MSQYISAAKDRELGHHEKKTIQSIRKLFGESQFPILKERMNNVIKEFGLLDALYLLESAIKDNESWGGGMHAVIHLFKVPELSGLDCSAHEFVKQITEFEPASLDQIPDIAREIADPILAKQIARDDTFLLNPDLMSNTVLVNRVPHILESRQKQIESFQLSRFEDGTIDFTECFGTVYGFSVLTQSGTPTRISEKKASKALRLLRKVKLVDSPSKMKFKQLSIIPEQGKPIDYSFLFENCSDGRKGLFNGIVQCLDPDDRTCISGIKRIQSIGHPMSLIPFTHALKRKDHHIQSEAIIGLRTIGDVQIADQIMKHLSSSNQEVKLNAIAALGHFGYVESVPELAKLAQSRDEKIAPLALSALCKIPSDDSLNTVIEEFRRKEYMKASVLASELGYTQSVRVLIHILDFLLLDVYSFIHRGGVPFMNALLQNTEEAKGSKEFLISTVRKQAIIGIERLGNIAVGPISKILTLLLDDATMKQKMQHTLEASYGFDYVRKNDDITNRISGYYEWKQKIPGFDASIPAFIEALGRTRSPEAIPILRILAEHKNSEFREKAIEGLSEIDTPAAEALLSLPEETEASIRVRKVAEIGSIIHPKTTAWLIQKVNDKDPTIRMLAIVTLLMRRDPKMFDIVEELANSPEEFTRVLVARAFNKTENPLFQSIIEKLKNDSSYQVRDAFTMREINLGSSSDDGDFWA